MTEEGMFLTIEEIAERLRVSDRTVRRWIESGRLHAYKPGGEWRIQASDLAVFLEARSYPKASAPQSSAEESPELRRTHYLTLWTGYILMRAQKIEKTIDSGNMTPEWGVALYEEANNLSSLISKLVLPLDTGSFEDEIRTLAGLFRALGVLDKAVDRLDDALMTFVSEKEREEQRAAFKNTLSLIRGGLKSA